jgi:hypothetical protein
MTPNADDLLDRLRSMATKIASWQKDAQRLDDAAKLPGAKFDDGLLLSVEQTSGTIYGGIATFDELVLDLDKTSHAAAGEIAEVGDALRLLLMEITELGTRLYGLRSEAVAGSDEA